MYAETTVIYSDVLFLINFSLDYLCLFITARLLNRYTKAVRLALGAAAGGAYSFVPYLFDLPPLISLLLNVFSAGVICFIAFGWQNVKAVLLNALTFIVSSALMGGLVTAIFNILPQYSNGVYTEISTLSFCAVCVVSALIALSYGLISRKKIHTRSAEIKIYVGDKRFDARLLADSGNLVTEPFSSLPVIVISSTALPPPYDNPESEAFPLSIRAIPFRTSSGESCFFGFRPDKIEIVRLAGKPKRVDAFVGIDTLNNSYSGYDGLLPTALL